MPEFIEMIGKKFADWTVICRAKNGKGDLKSWVCKCKCGTEKVLGGTYIRRYWVPSDCGCYKSLVGQKFGGLTVLERLKGTCNTKGTFKCLCECGREKVTCGAYLISGNRKSCGCRLSKKTSEIGPQTVYNHYKQSSKKRKLLFDLTRQELKEIIEKKCFYCGELSSNKFTIKKPKNYNSRFYLYNGIDRIDNNIGYILKNCVSCCKICNLMKRGLSIEQWKNHMKKILNHIHFE